MMLKTLIMTESAHVVSNKNSCLFEEENKTILNGVAAGKTVEDIARKHNVDVDVINQQLEIGIKTEKEHTDDVEVSKMIAMDHLFEIPDYYTRLQKMEEEAKDEMSGK